MFYFPHHARTPILVLSDTIENLSRQVKEIEKLKASQIKAIGGTFVETTMIYLD
jgi:hypothetical protein